MTAAVSVGQFQLETLRMPVHGPVAWARWSVVCHATGQSTWVILMQISYTDNGARSAHGTRDGRMPV